MWPFDYFFAKPAPAASAPVSAPAPAQAAPVAPPVYGARRRKTHRRGRRSGSKKIRSGRKSTRS
jgi:hypothetical protein